MDTFGLTITGGLRPPTQLDYHLAAFARRRVTEGWGPVDHFRWIAEHLFGKGKGDFEFVWTPQVEAMITKYCEHDVCAVCGHASSSKSATSALWLVINFIADPYNFKGIVVSTDLKGARKRIWGTIEEMIYALPKGTVNIVKTGLVTPNDPTGEKQFSERTGLELVAGNKNKEKDAENKIRGYKTGGVKGGRLCVVIDEGPGVADGIYEVFFSNVQKGNKNAQIIVLGNFDDPGSVFGQLCEPKEGWDTVVPDDESWINSKDGVTIHLDGLKSPNWISHLEGGDDIHQFSLSWKRIQEMIDRGETDTLAWWRDVRSFPAPAGMKDGGVATLNELKMFKATEKVHPEEWKTKPILFLGMDPAYVSGGDDPVLYPMATGELHTGEHVLCFYEPIVIPIDSNNKVRPPVYQIADYCASYCIKATTPKGNLGYDSTNDAFRQVFYVEFGSEGFAVGFGGSASEDRWGKRGPNGEPPPRACEVFTNRVSELHGVFLAFLRAGRIRGIEQNSKLCKQILTRKWRDQDYTGGKPKMRIESKRDMKQRTGGISPDHLDAAIIALATAVRRLRMTADTGPLDKEARDMRRYEKLQKRLINTPTLARHMKGGSNVSWRQLFTRR